MAKRRIGVVDDIILKRCCAQPTDPSSCQKIEVEGVARPPGDIMVRTGGVTADAEGTDFLALLVVECKTATKDVHPTNKLPDQRIFGRTVLCGIISIGNSRINRITELEPEKGATRLDLLPEIRLLQCFHGPACGSWQVEGGRRVRFLRRNDATAGPLVDPRVAGKRHRTDDAVLIDNRRPHVIAQTTIGRLLGSNAFDRSGQGSM